jgi:hypothetical protein
MSKIERAKKLMHMNAGPVEDVILSVIAPWNKHSYLEAAQSGDEEARGALSCAIRYYKSEQKNCLGCRRKFDANFRPLVIVVAHRINGPIDNDVSISAFCEECIDAESCQHVVNRNLTKLGMELVELQ